MEAFQDDFPLQMVDFLCFMLIFRGVFSMIIGGGRFWYQQQQSDLRTKINQQNKQDLGVRIIPESPWDFQGSTASSLISTYRGLLVRQIYIEVPLINWNSLAEHFPRSNIVKSWLVCV